MFCVSAQTLVDRARRRIRLRGRLTSGVGRVRVSWWSIGQSALGGALAWELAVRLLGHQAPFFASVAAIVCLSISVLNRLRRVGELALGVSIGVVLGDLLVREIGRGGWQLGVVVLIAMTIGVLFDGGALIVNQAALQAVFVAALPPPAGGYVGRWLDALLGGITALMIAFLLPADPRPEMRRQADAVARAIAGALRQAAAAARAGNADGASAALESARATQPMLDRWSESVRAAEEISRLSPLRRHADAEIAAHRRSLAPVDRAVRNLRVALRRIVAAVEDDALAGTGAGTGAGAGLPPALLDRLDELAGAMHTLPSALLDPDGEGGRRLISALVTFAGRLDPDHLGAQSMSATVVVAQLRSAVVDLLQVSGMSPEQGRALFRHRPPTPS
jgi:uncharacterized membrane protein YgaE (UPF0421/DUF939 family)